MSLAFSQRRCPGPWARWACLVAGLLALYLTAWPLVWRLVIAPAASDRQQGLRAEVRALAQAGGRPLERWLAGPQDLALPQPRATAQALAVWRVTAPGHHGLRLEADDYADLSLDRRLLIDLPARASDLNRGEARIHLDAGPHLLQVSLTNLEGQGWLRLLVRPPEQEHWQPLPREQLRPPDLGNLDFWLGLTDWLEGLCLWGLLGSMLFLPMLIWPGDDWVRRARTGLPLIFLGLPLAFLAARAWPPALSIPWLTTYTPDLRFSLLGLMTYAILIAVAVGLLASSWAKRISWWGLLMLLVVTRIYAWPYSMYCGLHPDWTSFAGFYHKFQELFLAQGLHRQFSLSSLLAYLGEVIRNLYVGYPSGCFSFPAFIMGAGALAAQTALMGTGAGQGFPVAGHLLGPAFNLAYALLLAVMAKRHLREPGQEYWSWPLVFLLCFLPTHIYLGANITYNLLADALHLALLLVGLDLMARWGTILAQAETAPAAAGQAPPPQPLLWRGLLYSLLLGLCLATKIVFIPALLTLLAHAGALMWRHRRLRSRLVWGLFPGYVLAMLAGGGLVYGLIIIRNVLNVPGFWGQLTHMAGDNTGLSLAKAGLGRCLVIFFGGLLLPNLGYAGTLAGGLGLALLAWRALQARQLTRAMVLLWVVLTLGMNLLSWSMLMMFNAMPRSSMAVGLWLALALYPVGNLWQWLGRGLGGRGRGLLKAALVLAVGLETILAGASLLTMYGAGAPRWQTEAYLRTLAGGDKSVAAVMYVAYGDDPNTVLGRRVPFVDLRGHLQGLSAPESRQRIISQAQADYWLLTSYEAYFLKGGQGDLTEIQAELGRAGYTQERRFDSRPFPGHSWLERAYQHFALPLMAGPGQGGLQEAAGKGTIEAVHIDIVFPNSGLAAPVGGCDAKTGKGWGETTPLRRKGLLLPLVFVGAGFIPARVFVSGKARREGTNPSPTKNKMATSLPPPATGQT
ncbi:MAG: hypothetical protein HY794_01495 [Desulfarculus sp.]|nr:hypothetical protein [Desulfarculus sp.]